MNFVVKYLREEIKKNKQQTLGHLSKRGVVSEFYPNFFFAIVTLGGGG